ncbi:MAG: MobC family plasmid mobilization relaxosome protein [Pseudomonadales bacterium]|jgi:hypothetical protein|nr:MobC family plasmid mobilization relaxosome protein [Pseudomonadales bacterium]
MNCTQFIKARVTEQIKSEVARMAAREMLSESVWLKRLLVRQIQADQGAVAIPTAPHRIKAAQHHAAHRAGRCDRPVLVRLSPEDRLLLDARAEAREMPAATYIAALTRGHLRQMAPLPKEELLALKHSIGELSAIGRNLNQIAKAANYGGRLPDSAPKFRAMLKICEALRDNTRALLKANLVSWQSGYGQNG